MEQNKVQTQIALTNAQAKALNLIKGGSVREDVKLQQQTNKLRLGQDFMYVRRAVTGLGGSAQTIELVDQTKSTTRGLTSLNSGRIPNEQAAGAIAGIFIRFSRELAAVTNPALAAYSNTSINGDFKELLNSELEIQLPSGKVRVPLCALLPASASPEGLISDPGNVYELELPMMYYGNDSVQVNLLTPDGYTALSGATYSYFVEVVFKTVSFYNKA